MALDPSIPLQVKSVQLENPLALRANALAIQNAERQNAMGEYTLNKARRDDLTQQAVSDAYRNALNPDGSVDRTKLLGALASGGAGSAIPGVQKGFAEQDKSGAELAHKRIQTAKEQLGIVGGVLSQVRKAPTRQNLQTAFASLKAQGLPDVDRVIAGIPQNDAEIPAFIDQIILGTDHGLKTLEAQQPKLDWRNTGQQQVPVQTNALAPGYGQPAPGIQPVQNVMSPGEVATDARGRAVLGETQRHNRQTESTAVSAVQATRGAKGREDSDALRKEFNVLPAVKSFADVAPLYNAAAKAPDTPAGDFALIYGVGKILDPGSVVREGEMGMVIKSGSPAQRVEGYLNYLRGKGRLTPELRNELKLMLSGAVEERQAQYHQARSTYEGIARERGYDPKQIFIASPSIDGSTPKPKTGGVLTQNPDGSFNYGMGR